jgi:CheY-like chemotaxis protein
MARVLLVDDEPGILLMLQVALESSGHEASTASDGQQALDALAAERFDVVLCDLMMPVLDGWGVLEAVRAMPSPPVVVVSAKSGPDDVRRALDAGATDFVSKPFSPFDLVDLVERLAGADAAAIEAHRRSRRP